jgi:hypothetical protein
VRHEEDSRQLDSVPSVQPRTHYDELEQIVRADEHLMALLATARNLQLPQYRVVAGCIYQTVWNTLTSRPCGTGINDYDLIYFDGADLSEESERRTEDVVRSRLAGFPAPVEVRNQARVHHWFENYFGIAYPPLSCADEAITRYASSTHAVGVKLADNGRLDLFAPFGLDDVFGLIVRPNYALPNKATHDRKANRVKAIWPELTIIAWEAADSEQRQQRVERCR